LIFSPRREPPRIDLPPSDPLQIEPPQTYAQWSHCLEVLLRGENDDAVACAMAQGTASFESGAIENFARRFTEVFDARLGRLSGELDRALQTARDEATLCRALLDARRKLHFLLCIATLASLRQRVAQHLEPMLDQFAQRTDSSLLNSAQSDRSGHLSQMLRRHSLSAFRGVTRVVAPPVTPDPVASDIQATPTQTSLARRKRQLL
jgi:hypothetical protein